MTKLTNTLILTALLTVGSLQTARAEAPRLVTATATVTWNDANTNAHTPVAASATVGIGDSARPVIVVTKAAFQADQTTPITAGVLPGETVFYRVTVTNSGDADAVNLNVNELLPQTVAIQNTAVDAAGWTIGINGSDLNALLADALTPSTSRFFWIEVQVQ